MNGVPGGDEAGVLYSDISRRQIDADEKGDSLEESHFLPRGPPLSWRESARPKGRRKSRTLGFRTSQSASQRKLRCFLHSYLVSHLWTSG